MSLNRKPVKGVLLDITGVLIESSALGDGVAIKGSIEAVERLRRAGISIRFVTNETQRTRCSLVEKLHRLGFSMPEEEVFPPAPALATLIKSRNLRPFLLVHPNCLPDLESVSDLGGEPNCVVLGDAADGFSYENLNQAFRILMSTSGELFSMGKGKYYQEDGMLTLDVGPFTAALEFATQKKAIVCGKPSSEFFLAALQDMNVQPHEAVMVGDDIESDVGGAQKCGISGVLVRTGKFRPTDEQHPDVKPDKIANNLAAVVDAILEQ